MSKIDKTYHQLLNKIITDGYTYEDPNRKNVNRIEIPSYTFRHEFKDGFPAISTKKLHYKNVVTELIWFLRGDTNIKYLVDNGCNIWNKDAYNYYCKQCNIHKVEPMTFIRFISSLKNISNKKYHFLPNYTNYKLGDLGPVYGHQWRKWTDGYYNGVDQIQRLITNLKEKPLAPDHIVNSWNAGDLEDMALPPCHYGFQIVVRPLSFKERCLLYSNGKMYFEAEETSDIEEMFDVHKIHKYGFELHWSQRSVDTFLGLPYNIASYATLALILEKITGYKALAIQGDLKKVHLYDNSLEAVKEQLSRDVDKYNKCELKNSDELDAIFLNFETNSFDLDKTINFLKSEYFQLQNYESYPAINVKMLERDK
jgi:thymidylate synthase